MKDDYTMVVCNPADKSKLNDIGVDDNALLLSALMEPGNIIVVGYDEFRKLLEDGELYGLRDGDEHE